MNFEINISNSRKAAEELNHQKNRLKTKLDELHKVAESLNLQKSASFRELNRKLYRSCADLEDEIRKLDILARSLEKIALLYENCEDSLEPKLTVKWRPELHILLARTSSVDRLVLHDDLVLKKFRV